MESAWKTLRDAGLPDGAARPPSTGAIDTAAVRVALDTVTRDFGQLDTPARETLLAWLGAWKMHWPEQFVRVLGALGASLLERLEREGWDPDRYLKLRRIALENLAALL